MTQKYDVVVIGSGFGGSVTACRLAQAGRSVCVLERGKRWKRMDFPRSAAQLAKAFWSDGESTGIMEYLAFDNIHILAGAGVGGGSLVYFNVHKRAPRQIFEQAVWPKHITRDVLDPYYTLACDMLDAVPLCPPEDAGLPPRTEAFMDTVKAMGRIPELMPIAVYTGPNQLNRHSGLPQSPCTYQGNCGIGCNVHAKNTLDLNYLALAEKCGAQILPLHQVYKIEPLDGQGYRVSFKQLDPDRPDRPEFGFVDAEKVIVSAGAVGTNRLLLRCRTVHNTLPHLSQALGSRYSQNGDFLFGGTLFDERIVDSQRGPNITAGAEFVTAGQPMLVQDVAYPDPFVWAAWGLLQFRNPPEVAWRALKLFVEGVLRAPGATQRLYREWKALNENTVASRLLPYLVMGMDAADGRCTLDDDGDLDIQWEHTASMPMLEAIESTLKAMSRAVGGRYIPSPLWQRPLRKLLTAHPLGGCVMADNPRDGVVNEWGEAWDYPNLFVADASIIPSSLLVNPSATISALAERIAFHIVNGRELKAGDPMTPANL